MKAVDILPKLSGVAKSGNGWQARCPAHEDQRASLSIADGIKGLVLTCHAGCTLESIIAALGLTVADLFNKRNGPPPAPSGTRKQVASYPYEDEAGEVLFEVVRFQPKDFRQHKPDGKGGWIWDVKNVRMLPFHLPKLIAGVKEGRPIYIAEGEKDVLALEQAGFVSTCNPGGAGKWRPEFGEHLRGAEVLIIADKDEPGRKHASDVKAKLQGIAVSVKILELPDVDGKPVKDAADFFAAGGQAADLDELAQSADGELISILRQREFDASVQPPPLRPIYTLAGNVICTPGNLTTITSAVKTGKSAVIGAITASALPHTSDADLLGFASENPKGFALLLFDSEQSPDDFWHCVNRALKRARIQQPPTWLHAYCLTGLGWKRGWEAVMEAIRMATGEHPGIHSVLLDGAADFVSDVNDPGESNTFVATLHGLAIKHDCPIVGVIHFNPGTEKTRGHLGSQLERKAETNLKLDKVDEVTTISSDKQRRAPISKDKGPAFQWDDKAGMHVSTDTRQETKISKKVERLQMLAEQLFSERPAMRYTDLIEAIVTLKKGSPKTAEGIQQDMVRLKVIKKDVANLWVRAT